MCHKLKRFLGIFWNTLLKCLRCQQKFLYIIIRAFSRTIQKLKNQFTSFFAIVNLLFFPAFTTFLDFLGLKCLQVAIILWKLMRHFVGQIFWMTNAGMPPWQGILLMPRVPILVWHARIKVKIPMGASQNSWKTKEKKKKAREMSEKWQVYQVFFLNLWNFLKKTGTRGAEFWLVRAKGA